MYVARTAYAFRAIVFRLQFASNDPYFLQKRLARNYVLVEIVLEPRSNLQSVHQHQGCVTIEYLGITDCRVLGPKNRASSHYARSTGGPHVHLQFVDGNWYLPFQLVTPP
jgi:hypothetical protein